MKIEAAIKQRKFANEHVKAHVNLLYTASWISAGSAKVLKPFGISNHQFNILRILRGMHPNPGSIKELAERMIDKSSNASRLVDKLISKDLVNKAKCSADNRRAEVVISQKGLALLAEATEAMDKYTHEFTTHLTEQELETLNELLDRIHS